MTCMDKERTKLKISCENNTEDTQIVVYSESTGKDNENKVDAVTGSYQYFK